MTEAIAQAVQSLEQGGCSPEQIGAALRRVANRIDPRGPDRGRLLTVTALAEALYVHRSYVWAMKRSGYVFTHGRRTTLRSARDWLAEHPDFKVTQVEGRARRRSAPPSLPGDKSGAPSLNYD